MWLPAFTGEAMAMKHISRIEAVSENSTSRSKTRSGPGAFQRFISLLLLLFAPTAAFAQADYYNTDASRPLRVEDAQVLRLYSLDLYLAPLAFERVAGSLGLAAKPGVAYGLVPLTQLQFGIPLLYDKTGGRGRLGIAGADVSLLFALRSESPSMPAIATRVGVLLPAGEFGPARTYTSMKAIASRTLPWGRLHVNGQYTFGSGDTLSIAALRGASANGLSRWWAGASVDRALPLKSLLLNASVLHEQPLATNGGGWWRGAGGFRYQLSPSFVLDGSIGLRLDARDRSWSFGLGLSRAMAVRALIPGIGAWVSH